MLKLRWFVMAALVAGSCAAKPRSEARLMSDMESEFRKDLGQRGPKGVLDGAPVDGVLAWLARQPAGVPQVYTDAVPIATRLAQAAESNGVLRTNATRLMGRLYLLSEPVIPASVAFDPNVSKETMAKYHADQAAYRKHGRDALLALAHDSVATVAAAATIELLSNATADELRATRPALQSVGPTLEANVNQPGVAVALLQLRGAPQAVRWLSDYAAHRPIPITVDQLAQEVKMEPTPEALAALETALVSDATFKDPQFQPKLSAMANTLKLPVYDADTERLQQMLAVIFAADPTRAQGIADKAPPKLGARLHAFLSTRPKS